MHTMLQFCFHVFRSLGVPGVFLSMFIENIGIPLPTELGYLLAREMVNSGTHSYIFILFVLTVGHVSGSIVSYLLGRWGDRYVGGLKKHKKITEVHAKLEEWYKKYGNTTILITRFVGYVRPWSSLVAGFAAVPFGPFVLWTSVGSLVFNIICLYFTTILMMVWNKYSYFHFYIIVAMFVMFFALIFYEIAKFLLSRRKRKS